MRNDDLLTAVITAEDGGEVEVIMPCIPEVKIELVHPNAVVPKYASEGDSGMDVYAVEDMILEPGQTKICKTGFKMAIPRHPLWELGYRWEVQARPRSGVSLNTAIRVANAPGTIDNLYKNEVGIILTNTASEAVFVNSNADVEVQTSPYLYNLKNEQELAPNSSVEDGLPRIPEYSYIIHKGDRVAQLVFSEVIRPMQFTVGNVDEQQDSRGGGFGHTGI